MSVSGKTEPLLFNDATPTAPALSICSRLASVFCCCYSPSLSSVDAPTPTRHGTPPSKSQQPLFIAQQALATRSSPEALPSSYGSRFSTSPHDKASINQGDVLAVFAQRNRSLHSLDAGLTNQ